MGKKAIDRICFAVVSAIASSVFVEVLFQAIAHSSRFTSNSFTEFAFRSILFRSPFPIAVLIGFGYFAADRRRFLLAMSAFFFVALMYVPLFSSVVVWEGPQQFWDSIEPLLLLRPILILASVLIEGLLILEFCANRLWLSQS